MNTEKRRLSKKEEKIQKALGTLPTEKCQNCNREINNNEVYYIEKKNNPNKYIKVCKSCYRMTM